MTKCTLPHMETTAHTDKFEVVQLQMVNKMISFKEGY